MCVCQGARERERERERETVTETVRASVTVSVVCACGRLWRVSKVLKYCVAGWNRLYF